MTHVFYKNRHAIGQLMIALMFVSGSIFIFMFSSDGFVSKSEATSCCCSGEAVVTSFAADSSGDYGSDIPMDVELTDGCSSGTDASAFVSSSLSSSCNCLGAHKDCGLCDSSRCNGGSYCPTYTSCSQEDTECAHYCQDEPWCSKGSRSSSCSAQGCPG